MTDKGSLMIRPFVYAVPSVSRTCVVTLSCLGVLTLFVALTSGLWICALVLGCVAGSVGGVILTARKRLVLSYMRHKRSMILSAVLEGVITSMILPASMSPIQACLLTFICTLAAASMAPRTSAMTHRSVLNVPALVACTAWIVGESGSSGMVSFPSCGALGVSMMDTLNSSIFSVFGITVPDGYMSLFWKASQIDAAACRFNVITLLSSLVMFSCGMADGMVTSVFLFVYLALVRLAGPAVYGSGDILVSALTGGTLFCSVFVIERPGTLPLSRAGRLLYAVLCGILAFFIAGPLPKARSIPFVILCGNVLSILMMYMEDVFTVIATAQKVIQPRDDVASIGGEA